MGMQAAQLSYGIAPMGMINGGNLGPWAPTQQTYAYPEGEPNCELIFHIVDAHACVTSLTR